MKYKLSIPSRVQNQLYNYAIWWGDNHSNDEAIRWLAGFQEALRSLESNPERFPLAPECELFAFEIRQLTYGLGRQKTHRAVFSIRADQVILHAIRHLAQRDLTPGDF